MVVPEAVLRVDGLNRIPDGLTFAEASVAEPLACAINAQELVGVGPGDDVVVIGAGPIGCLHVRLARARGAATVILTEVLRDRLELSADVVNPDVAIDGGSVDVVDAVREATDGRGPDVVITAAAAGRAQEQAMQMAAPRGRISFFGGLPKDKPTITLDSEPRALPRADAARRQRVGPAAQHGGAGADRVRRGAGRRPHHAPPAAGRRPRGPRAVRSGEAIKVVVEP